MEDFQGPGMRGKAKQLAMGTAKCREQKEKAAVQIEADGFDQAAGTPRYLGGSM
jgi:hypothetical protein